MVEPAAKVPLLEQMAVTSRRYKARASSPYDPEGMDANSLAATREGARRDAMPTSDTPYIGMSLVKMVFQWPFKSS